MTELYEAKRRDFTQSHRAHMHHLAWGIVCVLLLTCLAGLWAYTQALSSKNASLQQELALKSMPASEITCKVGGEWKANETINRTLDGRSYLVHLPTGFSNERYYPVLLFYPGKAASAAAAQAGYGIDELPAIVVYPQPTIGTDGYFAWQGAPYSSDANDVAFTSAILDELQAELCIDRTKIYAAGMSNGGGFVSLLSCELPERFAAFAIVAGAMYAPHGDCKPDQPRPLLNVHGDHDTGVPYEGSVIRKLPAINEWSAKRAQLNNCGAYTTQRIGFNMTETIWNGCKDGATVHSIRVIGGGHAWGYVTNGAIWQFLSRFSL